MNTASLKHQAGKFAALAFPALLLLGGCTSPTTVLSSANPSRDVPDNWSDYRSLPVAVRGVVPGRTKPQLAAMFPAYHATQYAALGDLPASQDRHVALYLNPSNHLSDADLCNGASDFRRGGQDGNSAFVVGALCDGPHVVTQATAYILTKDQSNKELAHNFRTIQDQLYQSLFRGSNDPYRYYEGY